MNQSTQTARTGLVRGIRRWDLVAVAINGIIGGGIFGLPSKVYATAGVYSLLAFAVCALVVTLIVLCFAEVGSRFSETGGPYLYARETFGPVTAFEVGWLMWLARLTSFAANCNLLVEYLGYFYAGIATGWGRVGIITAIVAALTFVNIVGVRDAALVSDVFSVAKLLLIALFIGAGLFFLEPQRFSAGGPPSFSSFSQTVLLLVYAFTGFEMAIIPAGETHDPRRNLPFALLTSLGAVVVIYLLIQVVCIGTLPELAASKRPLADASERFLGTIGGAVITVGAIVSVLGNLNVLILAAARLPFAIAEKGELPRALAATHPRFHTPYRAVLVTCAVMLALTLFGNFIFSLTISAIARLLSYLVTCVGLIALRRRDRRSGEEFKAQFRAPAGVAISIAALGSILWLLAHSAVREAMDAGAAAVVGLVIYGAYKLGRLKASPAAP
jgi:amino acid transporter